MTIALNDMELRVLGVLIEKSLTQPGGYPLTLNAILLGANQKQNRDPVIECAEADVARAVHSLQLKNLVHQAPPESGARANRFLHLTVEAFHWDRREQAVMAELMLRGRQTAGELRTRASRMTPIPDLEAMTVILSALAHADSPFLYELPREPGRSANRFQHLLAGDAGGVRVSTLPLESVDNAAPAESVEKASIAAPPNDLEHRVSRLESQIVDLSRRVMEFEGGSEKRIDGGDVSSV